MKSFFSPNIGNRGRLVRGFGALLLFGAAVLCLKLSLWLALGLFASGAFVLYEALRGWCALRACGIKTRL